MKTLVSSHTEQGVLLDIRVRIAPDEVRTYQSLIVSDRPTCTNCRLPMHPNPEDMHLSIYSPLTPMFGMDIGRPIYKCASCGTEVELPVEVDLHAFPSILQYVTRLRQEYKKRMVVAQMRTKGVQHGKEKA